MGIIKYQKKTKSGGTQNLYMVVVEATNKFTGHRTQMKKRGITSRPKAERVYRELWAACRERRPDGVDFTGWGELVHRYVEHIYSNIRSESNPYGFSPQSVRTKRGRIKHVMPWAEMHIDLVTPQFVTDELNELEQKGLSRMQTNHILKEVKCMFSYAVQMGTLKSNPFAGMKMRRTHKKRKEALTHEEVDRLLSESHKQDHRYYEIWLLTIALGLRRSELAGLKWIDIDFEQRLVYLRRQLIPGEGVVDFLKDREERVVAIPSSVLPVLKEMKLKSRSDFVINIDCKRWRLGQQAKVLREFCKKIGIKEVTHHQLRATHITLALIDGIPLGIVKENVGHAKLSTTDEYFRSSGIQMKGQTDGLRIKVPQQNGGSVVTLRKNGHKSGC